MRPMIPLVTMGRVGGGYQLARPAAGPARPAWPLKAGRPAQIPADRDTARDLASCVMGSMRCARGTRAGLALLGLVVMTVITACAGTAPSVSSGAARADLPTVPAAGAAVVVASAVARAASTVPPAP